MIVREPLPESGGFELEYVHSYYRVPATEHFVADGDGGFSMVAVTSRNEAVLDYYEIEGKRDRPAEGVFRLTPDRPQRFESLPLKATGIGQRTLSVGQKRMPLYSPDGEPASVNLSVKPWSPLSAWWSSWRVEG